MTPNSAQAVSSASDSRSKGSFSFALKQELRVEVAELAGLGGAAGRVVFRIKVEGEYGAVRLGQGERLVACRRQGEVGYGLIEHRLHC